MSSSSLQAQMQALIEQYGEWAYDIPLPEGVWTRGNQGIPHTRLKRLVQLSADLSVKSLAACRVLDLGALDGLFSIEFAQQGATVVGLEIRAANIEKARFCQQALGLENLEFVQDDARNISSEKYGRFDIIVCSGLLYHLPANDALRLIEQMYTMATRALIIDTHISLNPNSVFQDNDKHYAGHIYREHSETASSQDKEKRLWASIDNTTSFWFSRPSLINALQDAGFSSVYEAFTPAHLNYGKPGLETVDRCTFVALKNEHVNLHTSPAANALQENFPEGTLSYEPPLNNAAVFQHFRTKARAYAIRTINRLRR